MPRLMAVTGVVIALVGLTAVSGSSAASSGPHLVWRTPRGGAYRVLLPSTWRFANASYPSDHATHLWYDPRNALRKLLVVVSGCVGCVEASFNPRRPNPLGVLPPGAGKVRPLSPWKVAFANFTPDDPYPASGIIVVRSRHGNVAGSVIVELWLPAREHSTTAAVLGSFRPASLR